jgi:hypothetical protein
MEATIRDMMMKLEALATRQTSMVEYRRVVTGLVALLSRQRDLL